MAFGSETGQSRSIAQGMVDIAREQYQITAEVYDLDEVDKQVSERSTRHTTITSPE